MGKFTGQLRANEIFGALFNMIISQEVFTDNIKGTYSSLADKAKTDGSMYGDTKLFYATDVLSSSKWGNDAEAENLLKLHRPKAPECQALVIKNFRQISLTTDNYLTKRAWGDEGAFAAFNSSMKSWIPDTKKVYESTLYNAFIGTTKTSIGKQAREVDLTTATTGLAGEEKARVRAQTIAQSIADLLVEMKDVSRDFNDYKFLRSYAEEEIQIIWNSKYINEIRYIDLPTIFHKDNLVIKFEQEILPARYFGDVKTAAGTADGTTIRTLVERDATTAKNADGTPVHYFPGDLLAATDKYNANEAYAENTKVICKVVTKLPPFMDSFEVGTSFFNPKSLTENNYLTWGYSDLEYLLGKPFVTITEK